MQMKKFEASTLKEAIEMVKKELGPDAIILNTKTNKSKFGLLAKNSVEVTAAVSDKSIDLKNRVDKNLPSELKSKIHKIPSEKLSKIYQSSPVQQNDYLEFTQSPPVLNSFIEDKKNTNRQGFDGSTVEELQKKISSLEKIWTNKFEEISKKSQINNVKNIWTENFQDHFEYLINSGINNRLAFEIMKKVEFHFDEPNKVSKDQVFERVIDELLDFIEVSNIFDNNHKQNKITLVGATGVGKTTSIAKIAAHLKKKLKKTIGMINLDTYRIGAHEQLQMYSKLLDIPFRSIHEETDLKYALEDFNHLDYILIDTTGRPARDGDGFNELKAKLSLIPDLKIYLTLCASTNELNQGQIVHKYSNLNLKGLIFTKTDEAVSYGSLLNIHKKSQIPLTAYTMGQRVPEDFDVFTVEKVVELILEEKVSIQ